MCVCVKRGLDPLGLFLLSYLPSLIGREYNGRRGVERFGNCVSQADFQIAIKLREQKVEFGDCFSFHLVWLVGVAARRPTEENLGHRIPIVEK